MYPALSTGEDTNCTRFFDRSRIICQKKSAGGMGPTGARGRANVEIVLHNTEPVCNGFRCLEA